ncbi:MAG: hypothetical protein RIG61_04185 [Deltaproteobacteria bacterium]
MPKTLKKLLLVVVLIPFIACGAESKLQESTGSFQQYRCEIIIKYRYLREISDEFGNILLIENYSNIFQASENLVESLDGMKHELESMYIPEEMKEPHDAFLKSIESFIQSANHIHIAMGIVLGNHERKSVDIQGLIDQSEHHIVMANKYLAHSVILHGKLFDSHHFVSNECNKQIASIN